MIEKLNNHYCCDSQSVIEKGFEDYQNKLNELIDSHNKLDEDNQSAYMLILGLEEKIDFIEKQLEKYEKDIS